MCDKDIIENGETLKSVPDCHKNQEICNQAIDSYRYWLEFVPECYKTQKMRDKAVNTYPSAIKFVPQCLMTQEMFDKPVNICLFVSDFIPDHYKTQEMCDRVLSEDDFLIAYCPNKYKIQRICDEGVDYSLVTLKLILDLFVSSKIIENFLLLCYALIYFNEDSSNFVFSCNEMGILNTNLNNINLDSNFDEDSYLAFGLA